tara:strand:- start:1505 stop:1807 length:303 start_codon:yes stop_codon:yes gene_type:complete
MTAKITDNLNVVRAWREGKNARNHKNTLMTIDGELFSYRLKIGARTNTGVCVLGDFTSPGGSYHSMTTSCHVNLAKRMADMVMHPLVWETSPLSKDEVPF